MDQVFIKAQLNTNVEKNRVLIGDVINVWCNNQKICEQIKAIELCKYEKPQKGKEFEQIISIIDVIELIEKKNSNIEIENIGEPDFVIKWTFSENKILLYIKIIFVSLITFFGTSFAIMSFNEDVAVDELFTKIYYLVTGVKHQGFGVLELFYGIGLAAGIITFFNHFGSHKKNAEPTPIELKMNQYEEDVDNYMVSRK